MDASSPFALVLLGQPLLSRQLRLGVFAALDQRIAVRYQIAGMDLSESLAYLRHHLSLAGRADPLIADDAAARLHRYANGLPPGVEQRRHCGAHGRSGRGQGPGRRCLRQACRRGAHP